MPRNFEHDRELGRQYEIAVSRWLQRRGWHILPAYDYAGQGDSKAPKLMRLADGYIVPDLLACRAGRRRWYEVKFKTRCTRRRPGAPLETGINLKHWRHYNDVKALSGDQVWLVFVHKQEGIVVGASLTTLRQPGNAREYTGPLMGPNGMVFFLWSAMTVFASYADVVAENEFFKRDDAA